MILKADSKDSTAQAKGFFYQQKLIASCLILSSYTRLNGKNEHTGRTVTYQGWLNSIRHGIQSAKT